MEVKNTSLFVCIWLISCSGCNPYFPMLASRVKTHWSFLIMPSCYHIHGGFITHLLVLFILFCLPYNQMLGLGFGPWRSTFVLKSYLQHCFSGVAASTSLCTKLLMVGLGHIFWCPTSTIPCGKVWLPIIAQSAMPGVSCHPSVGSQHKGLVVMQASHFEPLTA